MLRDCLVALLLKSSSFLEGGHARHVKVSESLSAKDCDRVVLVFGRVRLDTGGSSGRNRFLSTTVRAVRELRHLRYGGVGPVPPGKS